MFVCTNENESIDEQFGAHERFIEHSSTNGFQQKVETERSKDLFLEKKVFEREKFYRLSRDWTILKWFHEYERGKLDVFDSSHSRRTHTEITDEMIDAVRLMIDDDPHLTYQQIDFSLGINSPAIYSVLHDHLKVRKICAWWVKPFIHQWSKTNPNSIWNDSNNDDLDVFLTSSLVINHDCFIIMIVKANSSEKRLMWKDDRRPRKVLWNEWSQFSSWRSELIESIPLESRVSINARTVCLGSLMLLDRDKRTQESVCWFCMMTMEEPIGLEWRPNI